MRWPAAKSWGAAGVAGGVAAASAGLPLLFSGPSTHAAMVVGGPIGALSFLGAIVFSEKKESFFEEKQRFFLETACKPFFEKTKEEDPSVRLNIMRIEGTFKRRFRLFYACNMDSSSDSTLELTLDQGVAGLAYETGGWAIGSVETTRCITVPTNPTGLDRDPHHRLTQEQRNATRDLKLIISYPIRALMKKPHGALEAGEKIIGVINIDTKKKDALSFYVEKRRAFTIVTQVLPELSNIASYVLSP